MKKAGVGSGAGDARSWEEVIKRMRVLHSQLMRERVRERLYERGRGGIEAVEERERYRERVDFVRKRSWVEVGVGVEALSRHGNGT